MSGELDEKGLEAAHVAYERYGQAGDLKTQRLSSGCIEAIVRAYLAASPSPSEKEVVAWLDETVDAAPGAQGVTTDVYAAAYWEHTSGAPMTELVRASQAQSALAAMSEKLAIAERNRDAGRDNFHTMQQSAAELAKKLEQAELREGALLRDCEVYKGHAEDYLRRAIKAETAEAQVLRLTEENEALRKERDEAIDRSKVWEYNWSQEVKVKAEIVGWCKNYQARIKALEEALTDARTWHEEQDKALSKQPPTSGPNGNQWARLQHREQIDLIDAAISTKTEGGE